jgi:hypothetical protein
MRQQQTTSETPSPGLEAERLNTKIIKTETLLHLNLEIFFIFIYLFIFVLNPHSLMHVQLTVD